MTPLKVQHWDCAHVRFCDTPSKTDTVFFQKKKNRFDQPSMPIRDYLLSPRGDTQSSVSWCTWWLFNQLPLILIILSRPTFFLVRLQTSDEAKQKEVELKRTIQQQKVTIGKLQHQLQATEERIKEICASETRKLQAR